MIFGSGLAWAAKEKADLFSIPLKSIEGKATTLAEHKGRVILIVNTASECGFTPQYKGLEALYKKHMDEGFVVLAFPSNDFGGQEPGSEAEIKKFCELKYKTTFPIYAKVKVKQDTHPLFAYLQKESGKKVQWNFNKYLVSRDGKLIQHFSSNAAPESEELGSAIRGALK